jgi:N-methylhydantoinase A/oxoprolinase/acetone carboxylase beta subunit
MGGVVGIDVGGTFTDLYYSGDGDTPHRILKVPSTPRDPSIGLLDSLHAVGLAPTSFDAILHGTTIATNAVIERQGAACALITTRGSGTSWSLDAATALACTGLPAHMCLSFPGTAATRSPSGSTIRARF